LYSGSGVATEAPTPFAKTAAATLSALSLVEYAPTWTLYSDTGFVCTCSVAVEPELVAGVPDTGSPPFGFCRSDARKYLPMR